MKAGLVEIIKGDSINLFLINGIFSSTKPSEEGTTPKPSEQESTPNNPVIKYGDVDGDGNINVKDGVLIKKHLSQMDVKINKVNSDVNGDGDVDIQDAILLMKHLAQMDVILGPKK